MAIDFTRDRLTWLLYLMLAFFAYTQAVLGPIMPFLGDELDLSYTVRGLHVSATAVGMITAGLTADRLARRIGRRWLFWIGSFGMATGAILLILARRAEVSIGASLLMGTMGGQMLVIIQSSLSDHHGDLRTVGLSESNVIASLGASLAPLLVGGLDAAGLSWRGAFIASAIFVALLFTAYRGEGFPRAQPDDPESDAGPARLPGAYWAVLVVIFFGVGIEWSMLFWGADFLENGVGMARTNAVTAMAVFFVAIPIGRAIGSRLARRYPAHTLLLMAFAIVILGFLPFWLARFAPINLLFLFITGLGSANLFPMGLALASGLAPPALSDAASGWVSIAGGVAILVAPQTLGTLADRVGISSAYGVVAVLAIMGIVLMLRTINRHLTNP